MADNDNLFAIVKSLQKQFPHYLILCDMGAFWELYFKQAEMVAQALNIKLTKRGAMRLCGIPKSQLESSVAKLLQAGFKPALYEKDKEGKRALTRCFTKATLSEDALLPETHTYLAACVPSPKGLWGFCFADISCGSFSYLSCGEDELLSHLVRLHPLEIIVPENLPLPDPSFSPFQDRLVKHHMHHMHHMKDIKNLSDIENVPDMKDMQDMKDTQDVPDMRDMKDLQAQDISSWRMPKGLDINLNKLDELEKSACQLLLDYLISVRKKTLPFIPQPKKYQADILHFSSATIRHLELLQDVMGDKAKSLFALINHTLTKAGARALKERLTAPSSAPHTITLWADEVESLTKNPHFHNGLKEILTGLKDVPRAVVNVLGSAPKVNHLEVISHALTKFFDLLHLLGQIKELPLSFQQILKKDYGKLAVLKDKLQDALSDVEGEHIKSSHHHMLFDLRQEHIKIKNQFHHLLRQYQALGAPHLKYGKSSFLGVFLEAPSKEGAHLLQDKYKGDYGFVLRQTLKDKVRLTSPKLTSLASLQNDHLAKIKFLEDEIINGLYAQTREHQKGLLRLADIFSHLDVTQSLAECVRLYNLTRPQFQTNGSFDIKGARHLVVEQYVKSFTPNDCVLTKPASIWLLTGANMSGKSTFLRQMAHMIILAQMGGFVPAKTAHLSVVDQLFTRIGGDDDLTQHQSSFMVEMCDVARVIKYATKNSFVVLDELGRSTHHKEAIALGYAILYYLYHHIGCKTLFATHYYELATTLKHPFLLHKGFESKGLGDKELGNKGLGNNKKLEGKAQEGERLDNKKPDNREVDNRELDNREVDNRELDNREVDGKRLSGKKSQ